MATTTMKSYGLAPKALFNKEVDFLDDVIKGMICTGAYVPNQDTHDYKNDVTNEVAGTGYAAGGAALTNKTITYSSAGNVGKIDADDLVWPDSPIADARVLVIYDDTPALITAAGLHPYWRFSRPILDCLPSGRREGLLLRGHPGIANLQRLEDGQLPGGFLLLARQVHAQQALESARARRVTSTICSRRGA